MKVISLDIVDQNKVIEFCKDSFADKSMPANENMDIEDWETKPHTLLHAIFIQQRFSKLNRASYLFLEKEGKYIASSGMYQLDTDTNICIMATRTYTLKTERANTLHSKFIFPLLVESAKEYKYKTLILTFNEYNLWLKQAIEKLSNGGKVLANRTNDFFKDWKSLDFPVEIQYTKQWVLYKHLDISYDREFLESMAEIRTY